MLTIFSIIIFVQLSSLCMWITEHLYLHSALYIYSLNSPWAILVGLRRCLCVHKGLRFVFNLRKYTGETVLRNTHNRFIHNSSSSWMHTLLTTFLILCNYYTDKNLLSFLYQYMNCISMHIDPWFKDKIVIYSYFCVLVDGIYGGASSRLFFQQFEVCPADERNNET